MLYQAGHYSQSAEICRARLAVDARDVTALRALAAALLAQGRSKDGLHCLSQAVDVDPTDADLHAHIGLICSITGEIDAAVKSYQRALSLNGDQAEWRLRLVSLLKVNERYDRAEDCCREGLSVGGPSAALRHALAGVLFEQGRVAESIEQLRASLVLDPQAPAVHSDLLRALNYIDDQDPSAVYEEHRRWAERHASILEEKAPAHPSGRNARRRLRVGYVSPYFRKHAVTFFLESVLEHHDFESIEVFLYADVARTDAYSERLKSYGAQWRNTVGLSDQALAEKVREDAIDILVDLSGHTPANRLLAFARRAAPVQVTWNGYPNTTGMSVMDYRITDARCDPHGAADTLHSERLIRLPDVFMSWRPPHDAPMPGPLPALDKGYITFGSFNSCFKITEHTLRLWSRLLTAIPQSKLAIFTIVGERAQNRIKEGFAAFGINSERLELRPRLTHESFLEAHREVDIALDPFPYHGTTTTCFSLWMGVPVIVLVGKTHASRVGLSLLTAAGLPEFAAEDEENYVRTAVQWARDADSLAAMRAGLRDRISASPLTDGAACARALEAAYREMWSAWCER